MVSSVLWAAAYCFWAQLFWHRYLKTEGLTRLPALLLFVQCSVLAFFFIVRRPSSDISWKPFDILSSFFGVAWPLFFVPLAHPSHDTYAILIQAAGLIFTIVALLSLNRAFGVLPANRGIQTGGMYRVVRHPLYASYQIANLGFLLNNGSLYNAVIFFASLAAQILRVLSEERLLSRDADYAAYMKKVRWRLLPFVF